MFNKRMVTTFSLACIGIMLSTKAIAADTTVVVQPNDTLSAIGQRYNISVEALSDYNQLMNRHLIIPGQKINIPSERIYNVKMGDTLSQIAEKYHVDMATIMRQNHLQNPHLIFVGQQLYVGEQRKPVRNRCYRTPVNQPYITSGFGPRSFDGFHMGVDIISQMNDLNIYAALGGRVVSDLGWSWVGPNGGGGNMVMIQQDDGNYAFYAHLAHKKVVIGQRVSQGDVIGTMGETGNAFGVHLHFELRCYLTPYCHEALINPSTRLGIE